MIGVFASVLFSERGFVFAGPPLSGDWVVTGTESYYDMVVVLNGNLIVEDGGNLTFRKVTLKMNCSYNGQYNITVNTGGRFYVLEGSIITSVDSAKRYSFVVWHDSTFRMSDSELHQCGWDSPDWKTHGLNTLSDDAVVENSLISHNYNGMRVQSGGLVIRNNNITANDACGIASDSNPTICNNTITSNLWVGIGAFNGSPVIRDNFIAENGWAGIFCGSSNDVVIENNWISNNWYGIVCESSNPVIRNNNISSNRVQAVILGNSNATIEANYMKNNEGGVYVGYYSSPIIQDNLITDNGFGIHIRDRCTPTILGNNITLNNGLGILSDYSSGIIQSNTITGGGDGVVCRCSSPVIQGNNITNNTGTGIWCMNYSNPTIQGNILTFNGGYGIGSREESQSEIHKNDIYGNVNYGLCNEDESVIINATYNYWGDGPTTSGNVLYEPWLTESIVPTAEITSPFLGEIVSSTVTVTTKVHAQNGVDKVEFYIDDQLKYTDYETLYDWNWDTTQYTETEHKITANAHDKFGLNISASITVFVDNTPPTVSIKEPTPENTYYGIVSVSVNATDNREMGNVHVKVDNSGWLVMTYDPAVLVWKYDLNTTILSDGQHTLMVLALDKASNPATTSTTLITDNTPPTLTIQAPQSGITVGLTLLVKVQASDLVGISRIEFYLQDVLVCTVYETPYQWSWDTTRYPNGDYTITVKAYDTIGNVKTNETTVTVQNVELPWWQTHALTIIQVLIAIGGLILGTLTYLTRKREKKRKKKKK